MSKTTNKFAPEVREMTAFIDEHREEYSHLRSAFPLTTTADYNPCQNHHETSLIKHLAWRSILAAVVHHHRLA